MLNRGFTLIEVLVTLVILLFGLLGIAGLMAKGQRASYEAYQRQQAYALASDMAERIRANRTMVVCGTAPAATCNPVHITYTSGAPTTNPLGDGVSYQQLLQGAITNCATTSCDQLTDSTALTKYDLAMWDGLLTGYTECQTGNCGTLPGSIGGIVSAHGCIEDEGNTAAATCPAAPAPANKTYTETVRVSVAWQGNMDTVAPTTSTCGTGLYGVETKRRLISLDLVVLQQCP